MIKLDRQVYIYSVDTSAFYNDSENQIHAKLLNLYGLRNDYKKQQDIQSIKEISEEIKLLKESLLSEINKNCTIRKLRNEVLKDNKVISIFDSVLTRTLSMKQNTLSEDIMVVQTYYFQILEDLIKNGFIHNDQKYIYLTSSAGQIRTKKSVFIREELWEKHKDSLLCGLSIEKINSFGGVNINKYQAYLALSNSATDEWDNFNIDRSIVVNDLETDVHSLVDYIDRNTYSIERKVMDIPIEHTDGCGMILPRKSKKSFMVRLPWCKGLLVPFPFDKFAKIFDAYKVTDIYGKEWDIKKDRIEVIFTKSQFKMWKYYNSWEEYKESFKKYKCHAAKLNEEDVGVDANLNYQMLQTLTDITVEELTDIARSTCKDILTIGEDKETMLRVLGATKDNKKKNHFQNALLIYPELLNDVHSKKVIKDKKKSLVKDAKAAKLNTKGKYTFLCPDLYAFCEKLFLDIASPNGLLSENEVYCSLYEEGKLDILRSPHLYREHGIKINLKDDEKSKWFITKGIYTSVKDPISKMLQFDNDGDKALVIQDETLVKVAERNMQGIVPLYYEMAKAEAELITNENIHRSLIMAYKANIGEISNNITKIWNSNNINLDVIKWLCMENNFTIDFAKTLFMPARPDNVKEQISSYIKNKVPYFFVHAKDKDIKNVEPINDSVVNKLEYIIPKKRILFKKVAGKFNYKLLMKNKKVEMDEDIIEKYNSLNSNKKWRHKIESGINSNDKLYIYKVIRDEILMINNDIDYVTDVLVKYLYSEKNSKNKTTLWESFGDVLFKNLEINLKNTTQCESCGKRIIIKSNRTKYCEKCWKEKEREIWRVNKRKVRSVQV
ncbi:hypothetical protein [Niallia sp. FSL M8-0099]|uniref:hypothetical protein n=1 Tax=Niallia sp. FSL M8-0099 TaxID=2954519 RepID=UPI0030F5C1ED